VGYYAKKSKVSLKHCLPCTTRLLTSLAFSVGFLYVSAQSFVPQVQKVESSKTSCAIALSPKNSGNAVLIAGASAYYSEDAGITWARSEGLANLTQSRLIADPRGYFYAFGLWDSTAIAGRPVSKFMAYQASKEKGKTWRPIEFIPGSTGQNKLWLAPATHYQSGTLLLGWTETEQASSDAKCISNCYFNYTSMDGNRWKDPIKLSFLEGSCGDSVITAGGPLVSTEGRLFALWMNGGKIYFDRSYNAGKQWLSTDLQVTKEGKGWLRDIPGAGRVGGEFSAAVDNSASFFRSSIYAVWSDQHEGDGDIWMLRSTSRGDLWTSPIRVNQDSSRREQFRPSMVVDQSSGIIYIVYFDRRAYEADAKSDVYLAYTVDGGAHFKEMKVSETPITQCSSPPGISAAGGIVGVVWSGTSEAGDGVWTTVFKQSDIIPADKIPKLQQIRKK
jgi:hypothetical protein